MRATFRTPYLRIWLVWTVGSAVTLMLLFFAIVGVLFLCALPKMFNNF